MDLESDRRSFGQLFGGTLWKSGANVAWRVCREHATAQAVGVFRAEIEDGKGQCETSTGERNFCTKCGTALWLYDPGWPELVHPFASAIDTRLPSPPSKVHLMLKFKAPWVKPDVGRGDKKSQLYPKQSLEEWHRQRGLWIE